RARAARGRIRPGRLGFGMASAVLAGRTRGAGRAVLIATAVLMLALGAGVAIGPVAVPFGAIAGTLAQHLPWHPAVSVPRLYSAIIWQIRLPRVVLGALVGAMLAGGGAAYQGVFRNPLADPYLLGVAAGPRPGGPPGPH